MKNQTTMEKKIDQKYVNKGILNYKLLKMSYKKTKQWNCEPPSEESPLFNSENIDIESLLQTIDKDGFNKEDLIIGLREKE